MWHFTHVFFVSVRKLCFLKFIECIILIALWMLQLALHSWDEFYLVILLINSFAVSVVRVFPLCLWGSLTGLKFPVISLSDLVSEWHWLHRTSLGSVSCLSVFRKSLCRIDIISLNIWLSLPMKSSELGRLCVWRFEITTSISCVLGRFRFSISF